MTITLDIRAEIGLTTGKQVQVYVTNLNASSDEMRFSAALTAAVKDFATNYQPPKQGENK